MSEREKQELDAYSRWLDEERKRVERDVARMKAAIAQLELDDHDGQPFAREIH